MAENLGCTLLAVFKCAQGVFCCQSPPENACQKPQKHGYIKTEKSYETHL